MIHKGRCIIMTRINCIPVEELHPKHLVAEYRELPRVFSLVKNHYNKHGTKLDQPNFYTLGTGHVKFFYNKLKYLAQRQNSLINEMKRRGYKPTFEDDLSILHSNIPDYFWNDWLPTEEAMQINRARIADRLNGIKA